MRAAQRALEEHSLIRVNPEGFKAFQAAVAAPAEAVLSLIELFQRRSPWDPGAAPKGIRGNAIAMVAPGTSARRRGVRYVHLGIPR